MSARAHRPRATAPSQYGHLSVTGAAHSTPLRASATLSGTLNLAVVNGFSPAIGNTFPVLTYGSRTGQFQGLVLSEVEGTTLNGLTIGNGNQFTPTYNATNLTLGVTAAPPAPAARFNVTIASDTLPGSATIAPGHPLQLSALTHRADGIRFRFPTIADRTYRLEGTADLASGEWAPLLEIEGGGEALEILDTEAPSLPRYFYRILTLP